MGKRMDGQRGKATTRRGVLRGALTLASAASIAPVVIAGASPVPHHPSRPVRDRVIDFRARPNTPEYMRMFPAEQWSLDVPRPQPATLADFIARLDLAGVAKAVFTGRQSGDAGMWIENDYIADCVAAHPERIVGVGGVDPRRNRDAVREARRALRELRLRGLAIDLFDLYPDDRRLYPLYHECLDQDVPVILTMGPRMGPFASPGAVFTVASDLPELRIVCSHALSPRTDELIALAHVKPNVYIEASIYHYLPGAETIMQAASTFLQDRVLYASGFPFAHLTEHRRFRDYAFEPAVRHKLLYANAARVLGLGEDIATD